MTRSIKTKPWKQTATGRVFPLIDPNPADVHIRDIANQLGNQCRYNGATGDPATFYSVAQHCVHAADLAPPALKQVALLHDAHEAYTGDLITPMKDALRYMDDRAIAAWDRIVYGIDAAIHNRFGIHWPLPPDRHRMIKHIDNVMLATEGRDVLPDGYIDTWDVDLPDPAVGFTIRPWPAAEAASRFEQSFRDLFPGFAHQPIDDYPFTNHRTMQQVANDDAGDETETVEDDVA